MTMTAPMKTNLQESLANALDFYNTGNELPVALVNAINAYENIANTPSVSDLITLIAAFEAAKLLLDENSPLLLAINTIENIALVEFISLEIGSPVRDAILADFQYPEDDLGVTYTTILADLKANMLVSSNVDTVAHFAATIFYTVKALNPNLSLVALTADIQATVDSGTALSVLVGNIQLSLEAINTATASNIKTAVFGNNMFTSDAANLAADIAEKEGELNFNQIRLNLIAACNDSGTNNAQFAAAIFNSLLNLPSGSHLLTQDRIERDVDAGVAEVANLAALKQTIKANLEGISSLTTTDLFDDAISEAVFCEGGLIPSTPHDLSEDLPPADALLSLQYIRTALISALNSFSGNASALANSIINAVTSQGGGTSLVSAELVNDILVSGDVNALAADIKTALTALNPNTLTASGLVGAIYSGDLITSAHKDNLIADLETRQAILNYTAMKTTLATAIGNAGTAAALADAIYNNIGSEHNLSNSAILADVQATIAASTTLTNLKIALVAALTSAAPNADAIDAALYGDGLIISADEPALTLDVNAADTAMDYRALNSLLQDVCNSVGSTITTPTQFVQGLKDVLNTFGGTTTANLNVTNVVNLINFNMANGVGPNTLAGVAAAIKASLVDAASNHSYSSIAIDTAIFLHINPSHNVRLHEDVEITEYAKNLLDVKTSMMAASDAVQVSTTPAEFAAALIAALVNGTSMTPSLVEGDLTYDIIATLAANSIPITTLAASIKSNLAAIQNNALTEAAIGNALYNTNNAIISSNPYEMGLDIEASSIILGYAAIKTALITYLNTINTEGTDVSAIDMAQGILNAIDVVNSDHSGYDLPTIHLHADIAYTISQNQDAFGLGCYQLAGALITRLTSATNSPSSIMDALFDASAIVVSDGNAGANADDKANLLQYITAVNGDITEYDVIRDAIVTNLSALSGSYSSSNVATAIVNGIGASSPILSVANIQANIDATSGSLSSIVADLISRLSAITDLNLDTAADIVNAIFAVGGGSLASSTANAASLVSDVVSSAAETNDYQEIITKIVANLQALSGSYTASDVAGALINGADFITSGANGNILNPYLTTALALEDVNKTVPAFVGSLTSLVGNLISELNSLTGNDVSADGIQWAIFNSLDGTLHAAATDANVYDLDLQAAAAAHSSLSVMRANFANVGIYSTSTELATAIIDAIKNSTSITTNMTVLKLTADIDDTLANNNSLTLQSLANAVFSSVYNGSLTTASIVNGIFGDNIQTTLNAHLLEEDLVSYELSRESTYYGDIISTWSTNFSVNPSTPANFATTAAATLALSSPQWTVSRITEDAAVNGSGSTVGTPNIHGVSSSVRTGLNALSTKTSQTIADVIYSTGKLVLSPADADRLTSDVGTFVPLYGGSDGIAANVKAALLALSAGYTEENVATAIIETITSPDANASPSLSVSDMTADIEYTVDHASVALTAIVSSIIVKLNVVIANEAATAEDLNSAIYSTDTILPSTSDEAHFEQDLSAAEAGYNDYGTVKTALGTIATTNAAAAAESVVTTALGLTSPTLTVNALTADFGSSVVTTLSDLVTVVTTRVGSASVASVNTAAKNLADAFFNTAALTTTDSVNFGTDITNAAAIDNMVTLVSVVGEGVCRVGATHTVYSCTMSNDVATVGALIAQNDCTLASVDNAERACDTWASQPATDFYVSYNGVTCSGYLNNPASACKAGLDYLVA